MLWVGVRYRGIALPDIMTLMQAWLNGRGYRFNVFEYVISGSATLIRLLFEREVEAAKFAEEFAGVGGLPRRLNGQSKSDHAKWRHP